MCVYMAIYMLHHSCLLVFINVSQVYFHAIITQGTRKGAVLGFFTLEDVLEEVIQEEIEDEKDVTAAAVMEAKAHRS
mgnify:FL=1